MSNVESGHIKIADRDRLATSVAEAATAVGVSKGTIRKAISEQKLKSYLVGRRRVLLIADLMAWITGQQ